MLLKFFFRIYLLFYQKLLNLSNNIGCLLTNMSLERHLENKAIIRRSQHGFMKEKSCLSNLILCDKVTRLVNEGKEVDVIFLGFSKAFATSPHSVILGKLSSCGLNRFMLFTTHRVVNWLNSKTQSRSECDYIWLSSGHQRCSQEQNSRASSVQQFY